MATSSSAAATAMQRWGLIDSSGRPIAAAAAANPYSGQDSGSGAGSGGTGVVTDIAGLQKNVGFLNWALGFVFLTGLSAIIASYLLVTARIDDRANKADEKIADLRVALATQGGDIRAILEKVDEGKPAPSPRPKSRK